MFQSFDTTGDRTASRERVERLRGELARRGLQGFLVPRSDEHQGEYVAPYAERLRWLTGFAGSAGLAVALMDRAVIFVDGRYTIQVREQTNPELFEPKHLIEEPPADWLRANLKPGQRIGYDPWLLTADQAERYGKACREAGAVLVATEGNPVDAVWTDQPPRPLAPVATHPTQYAGRAVPEKLAELDAALEKARADAAVLTLPDSIAWALNIRGGDIAHTPVALAFAILRRGGPPQLFIAPEKVGEEVRDHLAGKAAIEPPEAFEGELARLGETGARVLVDDASAPARVHDILKGAGAEIIAGSDPCILPKARKNPVELEGARQAHRRDGAAVSRFLAWFEREAPEGGLDEIAAAEALEAFRVETGALMEISFDTISAAGPHAALPHYHVSRASNRAIGSGDIYLVDSGAQYLDGTTDITRTVIVGEPTEEMRDRFTRVLKGHIAIAAVRFPARTTGAQLDTLARLALWQAGFDFDHGTGHGVGSYLSVHEGPARIAKSGTVPLETGMILSNEPGYYSEGRYGIRTENLIVVRAPEAIPGGDRPMHGFETITLAPIDRKLIAADLLDPGERSWLDRYHARVLAEIGPLVDAETADWLAAACAPLSR